MFFCVISIMDAVYIVYLIRPELSDMNLNDDSYYTRWNVGFFAFLIAQCIKMLNIISAFIIYCVKDGKFDFVELLIRIFNIKL